MLKVEDDMLPEGSQTGIKVKGSDKNFFDTDSTDSRSTVNRLAAAVAYKQATYFFTHTANILEHFGLAAIKEWIDSDDAVNMHCDETTSPPDREEIKHAIKQETAVLLTPRQTRKCVVTLTTSKDL